MTKPHFPAILQYSGQDELTYLQSEKAWGELATLKPKFHPRDRLIDVTGMIFNLNGAAFEASGERLAISELIPMIQAHAAICGMCCGTKFGAESFTEAFQSIASMADD